MRLKTIKCENSVEIVVKKSKFIANIFQVNTKEEAEEKINEIRKKYYDAKHNCYAYIVENIEKSSDDGEPSKTAGIPILNVLKKKNLNNILAVVIRYFGGIKLGAGGLVRAYSSSIVEALKLTDIIKLTEGYLIELEFNYDNLKLVDYILSNKNIIEKKYENNIIYKFYLAKDELNIISELEKIAIHISIIDNVLIEKTDYY